jgi:hypothetical protein
MIPSDVLIPIYCPLLTPFLEVITNENELTDGPSGVVIIVPIFAAIFKLRKRLVFKI